MLQLCDLAARGEGESPQGRAVATQLLDALKVREILSEKSCSYMLCDNTIHCAVKYSKAC